MLQQDGSGLGFCLGLVDAPFPMLENTRGSFPMPQQYQSITKAVSNSNLGARGV